VNEPADAISGGASGPDPNDQATHLAYESQGVLQAPEASEGRSIGLVTPAVTNTNAIPNWNRF
jgi:hypothetical protein